MGQERLDDEKKEINAQEWMMETLEVANGATVEYELMEEQSMPNISRMEVQVLHPVPYAMVASRKRHDIPQIVRDGLIDISKTVKRQLVYAAHEHYCSISIMGQLYLVRIARIMDENGEVLQVGKIADCTDIVHLLNTEPSEPMESSWKLRWDTWPWNENAVEAGLAGYSNVVTELAFHLRLLLSMDQPRITSHGIAIQGVSGVGKSLLLRVVQKQLQLLRVPVVLLDATALSLAADTTTSFASTNDFLAHNVRQLKTHGVLLIDNFDVFFEDGEVSPLGRSVLQLLDTWTSSNLPLGLVATTTRALPPIAMRSGRLERHLTMEVPTEAMREQICHRLLGNSGLATRLATITGGYVGKDLMKIARHAKALAKKLGRDSPSWLEVLQAQGTTQPSQLQDLNVQRPQASDTWDQFAGYQVLKKRLLDLMSYRFERKSVLERLGVESVSGILLYGPSGCGKTMLVRGLAAVSRANFVQVQSSKLMSKYFGETEKSIRELFARARSSAPCILFFDELDSIAGKRSFAGDGDDSGSSGVYARVLSTLLNELDGIGGQTSDIIVIAATNRLDSLDAALIRPGRMDQALEVGLPTVADQEAIFKQCTKKMPLGGDVNLSKLVSEMSGQMTGAEISAICKEAALLALRENEHSTHIDERHFLTAISNRAS